VSSQFHHRPRFHGPSLNPARPDFPGTVCSHECPSMVFQIADKLKRSYAYALRRSVCHPARRDLAVNRFSCGKLCSTGGARSRPSCTESPFALRDVTSLGRSSLLLSRRYSTFIAPTDSCARPLSSSSLRHQLLGQSPCRFATSPCWRVALPDVISAILTQSPGPLPRRAPW